MQALCYPLHEPERRYFMTQAVFVTKKILAPLYEGEDIIIGPTKGNETIANADDMFDYVQPDFKARGTDVPSGVSTETARAKVYEMRDRNATFAQMFGSLGRIRTRSWQQGQVIAFCRDNRDKLRQEGFGTFFPFKVKDRIRPFVACVCVGGERLEVAVFKLNYKDIWKAQAHRRVVVPQLLDG